MESLRMSQSESSNVFRNTNDISTLKNNNSYFWSVKINKSSHFFSPRFPFLVLGTMYIFRL